VKDRSRNARRGSSARRSLRAYVVREEETDDYGFFDLELVFAKSARKAVKLVNPHRFGDLTLGEGLLVERVPRADRFAVRARVANRRSDALAQRAAGFAWDEGSSPCETCELHEIDDPKFGALTSVCYSCCNCGECGHADNCPEREEASVLA
jgi:hypothetical protein